jgi:hypothetical protein
MSIKSATVDLHSGRCVVAIAFAVAHTLISVIVVTSFHKSFQLMPEIIDPIAIYTIGEYTTIKRNAHRRRKTQAHSPHQAY